MGVNSELGWGVSSELWGLIVRSVGGLVASCGG